MFESAISKRKYLFSLEGLGGLWISLAIMLIETKVLLDAISSRATALVKPSALFPLLLSYIASAICLPLVLAWIPGALKELSRVYRRVAERTCSPFRLPKLRTRLAIIGFSIPVSSLCITLSIVFRNPLIAIAGFAPTIIAALIVATPMLLISEHKKRVENELPWLAVLLDLSESVGAGIKFLSDRIRRTRILPAIAREFDAISRDSKLRSYSYIDALIKRSELTPSPRLARFLRGYATRIRSGSDIVQWLRMWILEEFMRSEFSYRLFSERASIMISQLAIGIYVFIPIVVATLGAFSSSAILLIPIIGTPALVALAYAIRPKNLDSYDRRFLALSIALCIATSIALYPVIRSYSVIIGWLVGILACLKVDSQIRECNTLRRDSFEILNHVTELRRLGLSIPSALRSIIKTVKLSSVTRKRLEEVLQLHELGLSLTETTRYVGTPSFLFKFVIFSLGIMHESGSSDTSVIQRLLETLRRIEVFEDSSRKVALFFDVLAIATIAIVVWIAKVVTSITTFIMSSPASTLKLSLVSPQLCLLIPIALLGYSLVSTILRSGCIAFELRHLAFLAIALIAVLSLTLF